MKNHETTNEKLMKNHEKTKKNRGPVKRGDILEYVMGTRTAGADPAWLADAEVVDGLCVFVYEFWNSNLCKDVYDQWTMCHKISEACCLLDDWLEIQVGAQKASFRCIDLHSVAEQCWKKAGWCDS